MTHPRLADSRRAALVRLSAAAAAGAGALPAAAVPATTGAGAAGRRLPGGGDYQATARVQRYYRLARY